MQITIHVKGTRPLIQHNERLANPLDPYVREIKKLTGLKKKTDEIIARILYLEHRAGYYETDDGLVGLPNKNVFASLKAAARKRKLGQQLEMALRFDIESVAPLKIDGRTWKPEAHMKLDQSLLYVGVRNKNNRVMRARPKMDDWQSDHQFELDECLFNLDELRDIAAIAGNDVGLCDWRPRFGTFEATVTNGKVTRR